VADRQFVEGDIVQLVNQPAKAAAQIPGSVIAVRQNLTIQPNAPATWRRRFGRLQGPLQVTVPNTAVEMEFGWWPEQLVVVGPWLGRVIDYRCEVTVGFANGFICTLSDRHEGDIAINSDSSIALCPGCAVYVPRHVLRGARWIRGSWQDGNSKEGICLSMVPTKVSIDWINCTDPTTFSTRPPKTWPVTTRELKRLLFQPAESHSWRVSMDGMLSHEGLDLVQ